MRGTLIGASCRHWRVVGFQISGTRMEPVSLNLRPEVLPPMIITSPVGRITELANCRAKLIAGAVCTTGVPLRMSMVKAAVVLVPVELSLGFVLVLAEPLATRMRPSSYIV